jgi:hypothetical protein
MKRFLGPLATLLSLCVLCALCVSKSSAAEAEKWEFPAGVPLKVKDVTFYTPTDSYQDWSNVAGGVFDRRNNISANRAEPHGNANREFPWKTGGIDESTNAKGYVFYQLPKKGEIVWWRDHGKRWSTRVGGTNWLLEVHPGTYQWEFPEGTLFGEVLTVDGKTFEVRLMKKKNRRWHFRIFRPFRHRHQVVKFAVKAKDKKAPPKKPPARLKNKHPVTVIDEQALADELELTPEGVAQILARPFEDVTDAVWAEEAGQKCYAPTTTKKGQIVPVNYQGHFLHGQSCAKCHDTVGKNVSEFQPGRDWYGSVRGGDGVFSFDIFDPARRSAGQTLNPGAALRTDLPLAKRE